MAHTMPLSTHVGQSVLTLVIFIRRRIRHDVRQRSKTTQFTNTNRLQPSRSGATANATETAKVPRDECFELFRIVDNGNRFPKAIPTENGNVFFLVYLIELKNTHFRSFQFEPKIIQLKILTE